MEVAVSLILLVCAAIGFAVQHSQKKEQERQRQNQVEQLARKYEGSPLKDAILARQIYVGMTVEQLIDAWGPPLAIDSRALKTKVVYTYKYAQTGARTFKQRVRVENGVVVGWVNT
jgi:hypothetical protein